MDNETKQRIADMREQISTEFGEVDKADVAWLLARLDSLVLMEEVDFAFYKGRVIDLEADLKKHGEEREAHGYSRGLADAGSETKRLLTERAAKAENALADCRQKAGFILAMLNTIIAKTERIKTKGT